MTSGIIAEDSYRKIVKFSLANARDMFKDTVEISWEISFSEKDMRLILRYFFLENGYGARDLFLNKANFGHE